MKSRSRYIVLGTSHLLVPAVFLPVLAIYSIEDK